MGVSVVAGVGVACAVVILVVAAAVVVVVVVEKREHAVPLR